jgi:hypothetical protein
VNSTASTEGDRQADGRHQHASGGRADREHHAHRDAVEGGGARDEVCGEDARGDGAAGGARDGGGDGVDRRQHVERPHLGALAVGDERGIPVGEREQPQHRQPAGEAREHQHQPPVEGVGEHAAPQARDHHRQQRDAAHERDHHRARGHVEDLQADRDDGHLRADAADGVADPEARERRGGAQRRQVDEAALLAGAVAGIQRGGRQDPVRAGGGLAAGLELRVCHAGRSMPYSASIADRKSS